MLVAIGERHRQPARHSPISKKRSFHELTDSESVVVSPCNGTAMAMWKAEYELADGTGTRSFLYFSA